MNIDHPEGGYSSLDVDRYDMNTKYCHFADLCDLKHCCECSDWCPSERLD